MIVNDETIKELESQLENYRRLWQEQNEIITELMMEKEHPLVREKKK